MWYERNYFTTKNTVFIIIPSSLSVPSLKRSALEGALFNIEKGYLDAKLLEIKNFVLLTNLKSSRLEKGYLSSLCFLGSLMTHTASLNISYISLICTVVRRKAIKEK